MFSAIVCGPTRLEKLYLAEAISLDDLHYKQIKYVAKALDWLDCLDKAERAASLKASINIPTRPHTKGESSAIQATGETIPTYIWDGSNDLPREMRRGVDLTSSS